MVKINYYNNSQKKAVIKITFINLRFVCSYDFNK